MNEAKSVPAIGLSSIALIIPAWQPEQRLIDLIDELRASPLGLVLVVDDGSTAEKQLVFDVLRSNGVPVLRHEKNLGKGRALKTGFQAVLLDYPHILGVVTADADGQHTPLDILMVASVLAANLGQPVLGARVFSGAVPTRSRFGNGLTRAAFAMIFGTRLKDTQSGLRGLPATLLPALLRIGGERYEYEMAVLAYLCRAGAPPIEMPIQTIYLEGNRGSHFNPVWDSTRIYFTLLRFSMRGVLSAGFDLVVFALCFLATHSLLLSVFAGRFVLLLGLVVHRAFTRRGKRSFAASTGYQALSVLAAGVVSYLVIRAMSSHFAWGVVTAKIFADVTLLLAGSLFRLPGAFYSGSERA